ncbi:hypothetical protein IA826_02225 [Listeria seeligeri]|uniref:toxin Cry1Ac domain D-VI-related protein n=1 Tax=Listeria seeligeri TaxID=1640 RepID=UPI0016277E8F|nr:toxin Cry1Ac domain D-VI-related protein [Listeria seeligeri]MBC2069885.1 hypothetical protein [Listeria seeligeri]MBC2087853.1 hypothetical protein [Listeria seeligeri]MBF2400547.1 hypothetical protein [Listeria seeligeri]MBF2499594.1 hypothetical protein [Listeria seeligeri]MBF2651838.1 hypothetical protein [Listeria seeligeri]
MKKIKLTKKHQLIIGITTLVLLIGSVGGYAIYSKQVQASEIDEAQKKVNVLFSDTAHTKLADSVTKHKLDEATKEVEDVKSVSEQKELLSEITSAEKMLDNQVKAEKAVSNLYQENDKAKFADTVSNASIDSAKKLTDEVTNENENKKLTTQIADIEKKFKAYQTADKATNDLFTDNKKTTIKDSVKQENIDVVKKQVNMIANDSKKTAVTKNLTKAQNLLNQRNQAEKEAEVAKQQEIVEEQTEALDQTQNGTESSDQSGNEGAGNDNASNSSSSKGSSKSSSSDKTSGGSTNGNSNNSEPKSSSSKSSSGSKSSSSKSSGSSSSSKGSSSNGGGSSKSSGGSSSSKGTVVEENEMGGTNIYEGW